MLTPQLPRWLQEFDRYLPLKTFFFINGNIYDRLPYFVDAGGRKILRYFPLREVLSRFLRDRGYGLIGFYDVVDGLQLESYKEPAEAGETGRGDSEAKSCKSGPADFDAALKNISKIIAGKKAPAAIVVDYASRLATSPDRMPQKEREHFVRLLKYSREAGRIGIDGQVLNNIICLICDKLDDIPGWLYINNPFAKSLYVDLPGHRERRQYFELSAGGFYHDDTGTGETDKIIADFVDMTYHLTNYELQNLRELSVREKIPFNKPKAIIEKYKFGVVESPWDYLRSGKGREKISNAENILKQRVIGQDTAVQAVVDIIKRAAAGLSGAQHSSAANKPKGMLFFAGPTGVGKTELAKALAELLFGDEQACLRFDMSEYAHEHSDEKLLGAPPGYIGYGEGGQLTNKIKAHPFSVLLFDEIEKAHPKIMDKFLQILEDGRMTDGKGETVYFSEAVIIFTSNIGAYVDVPRSDGTVARQVNILPYAWACAGCGQIFIGEEAPDRCRCGNTGLARTPTPYHIIRTRILQAIEEHFKFRLGRPELYNRIGNNFVVFDYIRPEVMARIAGKMLAGITRELCEAKKITVEFEAPVLDYIISKAVLNIEQGGRGVGNLIETVLINPLARRVFDQRLENTRLAIKNILEQPRGDGITYILDCAE